MFNCSLFFGEYKQLTYIVLNGIIMGRFGKQPKQKEKYESSSNSHTAYYCPVCVGAGSSGACQAQWWRPNFCRSTGEKFSRKKTRTNCYYRNCKRFAFAGGCAVSGTECCVRHPKRTDRTNCVGSPRSPRGDVVRSSGAGSADDSKHNGIESVRCCVYAT